MNADKLLILQHAASRDFKHAEVTEKIIGVFSQVYNELGFGFLECVYEQAMAIALAEAGLDVKRQISIPVWFRGQRIGDFKADMLVQENVLLELKAVRTIDLAFEKQLLNYLRATDIEVGLLLNFGHKPEFADLCSKIRERSAFIGVNPRRKKLLAPPMNPDKRR